MRAFGVELDRHLRGDPSKRNVGLSAAKLLQSILGEVALARHAGSGCEHTVRADEVATLPDAFARQPHRFGVVAPNELSIRGNAKINRRKWIARAQTQSAARGQIAFLPTAAIRQCQAIIALRQREVRIELKG